MNFDKYNDYTGGSSTSGLNTTYVGAGSMKVLAINPTQEQLGEIIGEEAAGKFNTEYSIRENYNKQQVRPLTIWVTDKDENVSATIINYDLGKDYVQSKSGKSQFFSDDGQVSWANSTDTIQSWIEGPHTQTTTGQSDWYSFVYKMVKWNKNDDVPFTQFMEEMNLDVDSIYDGDFSGLHSFVEYMKEKELSVIAMFTAKVDDTENGLRTRQRVLSRADYIFYDYRGVTPTQLDLYKKREQKQQDAGYQLTNNAYYIANAEDYKENGVDTLVPFDESKHMQHIQRPGENLDNLLGLMG